MNETAFSRSLSWKRRRNSRPAVTLGNS
jgi:hypothetical protein